MLESMFGHTPLARLASEMENLLDVLPAVSGGAGSAQGTLRAGARTLPAVNMWTRPDTLVFEAELPGATMDDLEILATDDALTLRGRRTVTLPEDATPLRLERASMTFERSFRLPVAVDADHAEASLVDGVLTISLPVAPEARPRRIAITQGSGTNPQKALPDSGERRQEASEESCAPCATA